MCERVYICVCFSSLLHVLKRLLSLLSTAGIRTQASERRSARARSLGDHHTPGRTTRGGAGETAATAAERAQDVRDASTIYHNLYAAWCVRDDTVLPNPCIPRGIPFQKMNLKAK